MEKPLTGISYLVKVHGFSYEDVRAMQAQELNNVDNNNDLIAPVEPKIITWGNNQLDSDNPEVSQLENSKHCLLISAALMEEQGCLDKSVFKKLSTVRCFSVCETMP